VTCAEVGRSADLLPIPRGGHSHSFELTNQLRIHYQVPIGSYSYSTLPTLRQFQYANRISAQLVMSPGALLRPEEL